jgi:hypothetical protein
MSVIREDQVRPEVVDGLGLMFAAGALSRVLLMTRGA